MAKNQVYNGRLMGPFPLASALSGDPYAFGNLAGIVQADTDANGNVVIDTGGVYEIPVKGINGGGNTAINAGDIVYCTNADTPRVSAKNTGTKIGVAWAAAGATAAAAPGTQLVASAATTTIQVRIG